jgi:hypothetical protein
MVRSWLDISKANQPGQWEESARVIWNEICHTEDEIELEIMLSMAKGAKEILIYLNRRDGDRVVP